MNRIQEIELEINELAEEILLIQSECNHPPSTLKVKKGNNNPDPLQLEVIHTDFTCGMCGKMWREDLCDHNWIYRGHGHNYSVYECGKCGKKEER